MGLFHLRNLVQNFTKGYKMINHVTQQHKDIVQLRLSSLDLSNHMALFPCFDTLYWKT